MHIVSTDRNATCPASSTPSVFPCSAPGVCLHNTTSETPVCQCPLGLVGERCEAGKCKSWHSVDSDVRARWNADSNILCLKQENRWMMFYSIALLCQCVAECGDLEVERAHPVTVCYGLQSGWSDYGHFRSVSCALSYTIRPSSWVVRYYQSYYYESGTVGVMGYEN